ncbi:MAG: heavy metal translocating P-type ATPase [Desulfovibrio sp.]|nr:heavy metal translocating P-type ATPase [Desulfovibrio sp.]
MSEASVSNAAARPMRSVYLISKMDCPMEEALIRKKLSSVKGIASISFNLMKRALTVDHEPGAGSAIVSALKAIDMAPDEIRESGSDGSLSAGTHADYLITKMDCPTEEALIRKKLASVKGIKHIEFNLIKRVLAVDFEPGTGPAVVEALNAIDMEPREITQKTEMPLPKTSIPWARLAVAGVVALVSEFCDLLGEWNAALAQLTVAGYPLMSALALLFALIAIALGGLTTFKKGWLAISNLKLNINALMAVAVTGAVLIGQFPEAAMVMVLFNISEAIEALSLDRARKAIQELMSLAPEMITIQEPDGKWKEVPVASAPLGAIARARPGEKIGLDGIVVSGKSEVNQAPITGESMPVAKKAGDTVYGGTINESGSFEFRVTAAAKDTALARIIAAVEEARATRAPTQRFVDVFAAWYTPCVFLLALIWALVPPLFLGASWHSSIYTALTLLVIGCPCALVISTPVTVVSGMSAATRKGILVKGGLYLERGRSLNWLALDKTGTLTYGKPELTNVVILANEPAEKIESIAAGLAGRSDHPVSRAIARARESAGAKAAEINDFNAIPGKGVSGSLDGQKWYLGNYKLAESLGKGGGELEQRVISLESEGKTVVALIGPEGVAALYAVADTARETSAQAMKELSGLGVRTMMLTGDNAHTAAAIARKVGVTEYKANLLPDEKLGIIEKLEKEGNTVGMAGDGINDGPALAKANIGFAMARGGTDTAIETADVALMDDDLRKIPAFIRLSRATHAILIENIAFALGIKAVFFALTLTGNATMWMAVFADVGAALLVVANGLRARGK